MPSLQDELRAELEAIRGEYVQQLPARIEELQRAWMAFSAGRQDTKQQARVRHLVHRFAGSGATFGFQSMSNVARALEAELKAMAPGVPAPHQLLRLEALLAKLYREAKRCAPAAKT